MSNNPPVNRSRFLDPSELADNEALTVFRDAVHTALTYEHTLGGSSSDAEDSGYLGALRGQLSENFFESRQAAEVEREAVYVDQKEFEEVLTLARKPGVVLLQGDRGGGKSTLILRLLRSLAESYQVLDSPKGASGIAPSTPSDHVVIYIDVSQHVHEMKEGEGRRPQVDVCHLLYRTARRRLLSSQRELASGWDSYCTRLCDEFEDVFDELDSQDIDLASEKDVRAALQTNEELRGLIKSARKRFNRRTGTYRFGELVKYLSQEHKHLVVIVDNLDRCRIAVQNDVLNTLRDLTRFAERSLTAIPVLRRGNVERLGRHYHGDSVYWKKTIKGVTITNSGSDFQQFLKRRLAYVSVADVQAEGGEEAVIQLADDLRLSPEELLDAHSDLFAWFVENMADGLSTKSFLSCHNHSLRGAAGGVFNFVNSYVLDRDPLYPYSQLVTAPWPPKRADPDQADLVRGRDLASAILRHQIFMGRRAPDAPALPLVFGVEGNRPRSDIPNLAIAVLSRLRTLADKNDGAHTTWGALRADFESFNVEPYELADLLRILDTRINYEPAGLLEVDIRRDALGYNMPTETVILLLPAGKEFLDRIAPSVEYLFWSAMYRRDGAELAEMGRGSVLTPAMVLDDTFRARAATNLLCDKLWPRMADFGRHPKRGGPGAQRFSRYCRLLGIEDADDTFLVRAVAKVDAFVEEGEQTISSVDRAYMREKLRRARRGMKRLYAHV